MASFGRQNVLSTLPRNPPNRNVIKVKNIPKSITRNDLLRMLADSRAKYIIEAQINYRRFLPSGSASLTVSSPHCVDEVRKSLRRASISEYFLKYDIAYSNPLYNLTHTRNRGVKGKEEAAQREVLMGDGPGAGISDRGKAVVIWGLPRRITPLQILEILRKEEELPEISPRAIAPIPPRENELNITSRALVRLENTRDAHLLARRIHKTTFAPPSSQRKFEIHARVVY